MATGTDIFLAFLAILFPPLPVWVKCGLCSVPSLINLVLCVLGFIPGFLHALYIVFTVPDPYEVYQPIDQSSSAGAAESGNAYQARGQDGNVRYVYVYQAGGQAYGPGQGQGQQQGSAQAQGGQQQGYGSMMPSNGTFGTTAPQPEQGPVQQQQAPPAYEEAIKGDHKVQRP